MIWRRSSRVEIDRKGMAQAPQRGKAQRRPARTPSWAPPSAPRSLSAKESTTMSPGGWRRSTACRFVERDRGGRKKVHVSRRQGRFDGCAVKTLEADHHKPTLPVLAIRPGRSKWWAMRRPTPCTTRRMGRPSTGTKPLMRRTPSASAAFRPGPPGPPADAHDADRDGDALEIVVIVLAGGRRDARGARQDRLRPPASRPRITAGSSCAVHRLDDLDRARKLRVDLGLHPRRSSASSDRSC